MSAADTLFLFGLLLLATPFSLAVMMGLPALDDPEGSLVAMLSRLPLEKILALQAAQLSGHLFMLAGLVL